MWRMSFLGTTCENACVRTVTDASVSSASMPMTMLPVFRWTCAIM